ncbi:MAG: hypothetical protein M1816_007473 [Peltula sp. TS41687]|nr:MAG: hypothetical protein M1816_007473 [Peltula sp. TS41687]
MISHSTPSNQSHPVSIPVPADNINNNNNNNNNHPTSVRGHLHLPTTLHTHTALILLSGASGGITGPSAIYPSIAHQLSSPPDATYALPVLRLDYRHPARTQPCSADVVAAMDFLTRAHAAIERFVLVGWSFGGAPVFSVAGKDARVVGCATVASQTAETEGIRTLPPRPLLLLHGTADRTLGDGCSRRLLEAYVRSGGRRGVGGGELRLFEGDDHCLTRSAVEAEEAIAEFVMRCAGVGGLEGEEKERERLREELVSGGIEERKDLMRKAEDLDGERIE